MAESELAGRPAMVYRAPNMNARQYTRFIIEPVTVYRGSDATYEGTNEQELQELARFMRSEFVRVLGTRYPVVTAPGPNVARVKLMLAGVEGNTPVLAPVSRVLPVGLVANAAKSVGNAPGSFSGSATLAGEIVDSTSNAVLVSFVQKRYPDALDIGSTLSSNEAHKAAITGAAEAFRKRLDDIHSGSSQRSALQSRASMAP